MFKSVIDGEEMVKVKLKKKERKMERKMEIFLFIWMLLGVKIKFCFELVEKIVNKMVIFLLFESFFCNCLGIICNLIYFNLRLYNSIN